MQRINSQITTGLTGIALFLAAGSAYGGSHTWDVNELFSNADGTIQFVELKEANGTPGETGLTSQTLASDAESFTIGGSIVGPTSNKFFLIATQAFADLPGAPTPDAIIPPGVIPFINISGDTITYGPYDSLSFSGGQLPTDGINSLTDGAGAGVNSPTNYAGETASIDVSGGAVPAASTWGLAALALAILSAGSLMTLRSRRPA